MRHDVAPRIVEVGITFKRGEGASVTALLTALEHLQGLQFEAATNELAELYADQIRLALERATNESVT